MRFLKQAIWSLAAVAIAAAAGWGGFTYFSEMTLREAQSQLRAGEYTAAKNLAEAWLAEHPDDQRAMLVAAGACAHMGHWEAAEAYFALARPRKVADLHLRARGLVTRKLWDEAAVVFEQILQIDPMNGDALQRMAAIRGEQMRMDESLIFSRRLCQVPSHRVTGYVLTGMLELQFRDPARAVESLETALRLSPDLEGAPVDPATVRGQLAETLFMLGRPADAAVHALEAREHSTVPEPCWVLGRVRQHEGDEEGARRYWEEAVARKPDFVPALRELGRLALLQQQPNDALAWLLRAHEANPADTAATQALAATYRKLGQEDKASELLKELPKTP